MIVRFAAAPWLIEKDKKASRFEPSCPHRNFLGVIIFGSVRFLSKKVTKLKFFFEKKPKPNRNRVKLASFGLVRFCFLGQKPVQTGLARFFRFWLGFLGFGSVFSGFGSVFFGLARFFWFDSVLALFFRFGSVLARFFFRFFVGFGSVRFGFFGFLFIKPKPNRTGRFFQKINRFFSVRFFRLIFFRFSRFNRFSGFFAHP
jgi:hypothetical protein